MVYGGDGGEVGSEAGQDLGLDLFPATKPIRECELARGVHRKEGIGDDFEARESAFADVIGAAGNEPGDFHLGKCGDLRQTRQHKREAGVGSSGEAGDGFGEGVVEEDFVDDEGEVVAETESLQLVAFDGVRGMAGRVVGMDEQNGSGARGDASFEFCEVDPPAEVVKQRVGLEDDVVKAGEEVEERVTGLGDKYLITRVAEQPEEKAVSFAGAGCEDDVRGIDRGGVAGVVD